MEVGSRHPMSKRLCDKDVRISRYFDVRHAFTLGIVSVSSLVWRHCLDSVPPFWGVFDIKMAERLRD